MVLIGLLQLAAQLGYEFCALSLIRSLFQVLQNALNAAEVTTLELIALELSFLLIELFLHFFHLPGLLFQALLLTDQALGHTEVVNLLLVLFSVDL